VNVKTVGNICLTSVLNNIQQTVSQGMCLLIALEKSVPFLCDVSRLFTHGINQTLEFHRKSNLDTGDMHNTRFVRGMHLAQT
jgi:hypothetical protein